MKKVAYLISHYSPQLKYWGMPRYNKLLQTESNIFKDSEEEK